MIIKEMRSHSGAVWGLISQRYYGSRDLVSSASKKQEVWGRLDTHSLTINVKSNGTGLNLSWLMWTGAVMSGWGKIWDNYQMHSCTQLTGDLHFTVMGSLCCLILKHLQNKVTACANNAVLHHSHHLHWWIEIIFSNLIQN